MLLKKPGIVLVMVHVTNLWGVITGPASQPLEAIEIRQLAEKEEAKK
jgi:hypothetical protein